MRCKLADWITGTGLLLTALPLPAHHSFDAQYDRDHPITVTGTVKQVIWNRPHVRLFLEVKNDGNLGTNWEWEMDSPNGLMKQGWRIDSLKSGDQVTVSGFPARDGSKIARASKVTRTTR